MTTEVDEKTRQVLGYEQIDNKVSCGKPYRTDSYQGSCVASWFQLMTGNTSGKEKSRTAFTHTRTVACNVAKVTVSTRMREIRP